MGSLDTKTIADLGNIQKVITAGGGVIAGLGAVMGLVLALAAFAPAA
ncbi:hypothetical protein AB4Z09_17630 [Rhodococcus sp. TAF43]